MRPRVHRRTAPSVAAGRNRRRRKREANGLKNIPALAAIPKVPLLALAGAAGVVAAVDADRVGGDAALEHRVASGPLTRNARKTVSAAKILKGFGSVCSNTFAADRYIVKA